ncbi:alpha/beta hydrolase [Epidermidibacterium keratini]
MAIRSDDQDAVLLLHGAGGYDEDRQLAAKIGVAAGVPVRVPRLPEDDLSYTAWSEAIAGELARLEPGAVVLGHSFGASILLRVLAQTPSDVGGAVLLAMPHWGAEGWDVADYAFEGPVPSVPLVMHHCRDDDIVPIEHLDLNAAQLPSAIVREHSFGGHQLAGLGAAIARDIAAVAQ